MDAARPTAVQVADRALVLYALVRRGYIEHVIANTGGDPLRIRQGESAREETDRWLDRVQRDGVTEVILATNPNLEGNAPRCTSRRC